MKMLSRWSSFIPLSATALWLIAFTSVGHAAGVTTPAFSPVGGNYLAPQTVTLSTTTAGATIRYTADGTTPSDTVGTVYTGSVPVSATTTLKAVA